MNKNKSVQIVIYLIIAIIIDALGNALTVSLNLGSAFWTASAVNLSHLTHIDLQSILIIYGIIVIIINVIFLKKIEPRRIFNNFLFMIPFSLLVGYTTKFFNLFHINHLNLFIRIFLDFIGIIMIAAAISILQRVNILLHPNDDLMQIIRFKFFKGRASIAMWVSFIPPIIISLICFVITKKIYAINIGTIFSLLFQGSIIGISDRVVFPQLKHRKLSKIQIVSKRF
ncbi:hypothetical protein [Xylocopilactobacillus apis]|uniref:Sugar specific permease n=1 Tax=Xylocopilactobacillus apis TaxID=2932183 RepID=A0AAU9CRQ0_9LACO|nr:hypothetical protein [Xylocopilactobacillus apis]BDR56617.1 hypothetical protein KIMC2_11790 [Xylocopilactobacillus apis]